MAKNCLDLTGRIAVVFGATSGLGREIAVGLAEHGADVVPVGRRTDLVADVCDAIAKIGRRTVHAVADVTDQQSIEQTRESLIQTFGRVDVLVNAAGITFRKPSVAITDAEWSSLFETNLEGVLRTCQAFYEPLKANGVGRVINIASLGSYVAFHEVAAYCASKAAVLSLTRSLGCEWARDRICVNAIAPGV
ncbi:MAG: SDR family NAD(P)-dependent oxidoreductase, partial [Acidobacteriaceae bacterium]|nr:SDR family NAD(P)-dependent oxidoreductase [Acidobacteriaceae bacterium]